MIRRGCHSALLLASASPSGKTQVATKLDSKTCMEKEAKYNARNYAPIPVVISKASGAEVWDPEGNKYYDFLSAYSAVTQGHCHPKIIAALIEQAQRCCLTSRAFFNDCLGEYAEFITSLLGYEMVLPMNTGVEAWETAFKTVRRWGYEVKGIPDNQAIVICMENAFHGRSVAAISCSTDPESQKGYGPFVPGIVHIPFNDIPALEKVLEQHGKNVCAYMAEPIQGEAGVFVPDAGYFNKVAELCKKHNVLFVADEIQTGLGRTGRMLAVDHDNVRPDVVILGKALSGGVYPVSAVVADRPVLGVFTPGTHGSTFGGNPLGCKVATRALQVLVEEKLTERADTLGKHLRSELQKISAESGGFLHRPRGRGLLCAFDVKNQKGKTAMDFCLRMKDKGVSRPITHKNWSRPIPHFPTWEDSVSEKIGRQQAAYLILKKKERALTKCVLAKPTHGDKIRLAPPAVITQEQLDYCIGVIAETAREFK